MAIDITNQEVVRKLTLKDLIQDAVERKDIDALRFLEDESSKKLTRTNKDGKTYEVDAPIIGIRAAYLKTYLGYVPQSELNQEVKRAADKAKRAKEKADLFADAFNQIKGI